MEGAYKQNIQFPNGKYEIIHGITHEYGMGGPYASTIYLKPKEEAPFFISDMVFGDVLIADDESCFYFLFLNTQRKLQVAQYELESNTLKFFKNIFDYAELEAASTKYGYSVNGKNWIEGENRYNEGLIFCETNEISTQTQHIVKPYIKILPNQGFDFITFYDDRKLVNERLKDAISFPDGKIDYFTKHGYHIHYNDNDIVEFIEIMGDMDSTFELYGKNPFETDVNEIIDLLRSKNNGEENLIQAPTSYMFLELGLGIFRSSTPENYIKYIEQTKIEQPDDFAHGTPEWMLEGLEKTKRFQTIGLGNNKYFRHPIYFSKI
jgi:hypothetical protein